MVLACDGAPWVDPPTAAKTDSASGSESDAATKVALPELKTALDASVPDDAVAVWITDDALRVGRTGGQSKEVLKLSGGQVDAGAPEVLEELATALVGLPQPEGPRFVRLSTGGGTELVLFAGGDVKTATLRRVLTTARATGHLEFSYAVAASGGTQVLQVPASSPVRTDKGYVEPPPRLKVKGGELRVNARKFDRGAALKEITRQLEFREGKCVLLEAADDVAYAEWIALVQSLLEAGAECVTPYSAAASADYFAPPPAPPEEIPEEEGDTPPAQAVPETPPAPPPPVPPGTDRVAHWWAAALEAEEQEDDAACKEVLSEQQAKFAAEKPKTKRTLIVLARFEKNCGDAIRSRELMRMRTELFPKDAGGWTALGLLTFEPLFPDPGEQFRKDMDASTRFETATRAIETFESGLEHSPNDRDLHTWAAMAYVQRKLAAEGAKPTNLDPKLHARVDTMKAWQHHRWLCDHAQGSICTEAPQTDAEHAADLAVLAKAAKK